MLSAMDVSPPSLAGVGLAFVVAFLLGGLWYAPPIFGRRWQRLVGLEDEVLRATGSRSGVKYQPLPKDDPKQRKPDIERARKLLRWEPRVPLQEGLRRTIDYFCGQRRSQPV